MIIPKSFKLVNKTYKVKLVTVKQFQKYIDTLPSSVSDQVSANDLGLCDPQTSTILINNEMQANEDDQEHTYCHELIHALKFANGEREHNEEEVDRLGGMLHQYLLTKVDR